MDPAIQGQDGSGQTSKIGATIERFGLWFDVGLPLMIEYNARCQPPWDDRDLERKLAEGMKKATANGETGNKLNIKDSTSNWQIDPGTIVVASDRRNKGTVIEDRGDSCLVRFVSPEGNTKEKELPKSKLRTADGEPLESTGDPLRTFAGLDVSDLEQYVDWKTDWLVDDIFSADQPTLFGAASNATKTTQLIDLAVSLATESPWLGAFPVSKRRKVLLISGESNYRAASKRIKRALDSRENITWSDVENYLRVEAVEFPSLPSHSDRAAIARDVKQHGFEVVIIDPLYRGLQGLDLFKMNEVGEANH